MHYSKIEKCDLANGPGIRLSLFVSGCEKHCKGCFNSEAWDKNYGQEFTEEIIQEIIKEIEEKDLAGLSILGGDPLEDYNLEMVNELIDEFQKHFGQSKTIWMWTGYTIDEIVNKSECWEVARKVDVLVDGPFILSKKDLSLPFRGSKNQCIIDMQASQTFNTLILKEEYNN